MSADYLTYQRRRGFTLLELLVATAIFAVLFTALYSVLHGALMLRERTYDAVERGLPRSNVATIMKRDLINMVAPVGLLAGAMIGESEEQGANRLDIIEFYTASGIVTDKEPWGDIQKIEYYLLAPEDIVPPEDGDGTIAIGLEEASMEGSYLIRAITRNLLASTTEEPEQQALLGHVASLEFTYYDGEDWLDSWDSTTVNNETPEAIKARMTFLAPEEDVPAPAALEVVCEIVAKPLPDSSGQPGGDGDGDGNQGGQQAGGGNQGGQPQGGGRP